MKGQIAPHSHVQAHVLWGSAPGLRAAHDLCETKVRKVIPHAQHGAEPVSGPSESAPHRRRSSEASAWPERSLSCWKRLEGVSGCGCGPGARWALRRCLGPPPVGGAAAERPCGRRRLTHPPLPAGPAAHLLPVESENRRLLRLQVGALAASAAAPCTPGGLHATHACPLVGCFSPRWLKPMHLLPTMPPSSPPSSTES